jgi:hypothetical protein
MLIGVHARTSREGRINHYGPPVLDWDRVARWTSQVAAGEFGDIGATFETNTGQPPTVIWSPVAEDIAAPQLRFLLDYWSTLADGALPNLRQIDPFAMRPALGYVMLIDVVESGRDFRYRLYGSIIAGVSNLDMTGRLMSDHSASAYVTEFALAVNRAVGRRRLPIYTERTPTSAERTTRWQRLALPLVDDAGAVMRLLAGTVPIDRDGRVIGS